MGRSRKFTYKAMEAANRAFLADPDSYANEAAIAVLKAPVRPPRQPKKPAGMYIPDDHQTTSYVIPYTIPEPKVRKRQKVQKPSDSSAFNWGSPTHETSPFEFTPEELQEQRAHAQKRRVEALAFKWGTTLGNLSDSYLVVGEQGGLPSTEISSPTTFKCQCSEKAPQFATPP